MHEGFVLTADAISTIARLLRRGSRGEDGVGTTERQRS